MSQHLTHMRLLFISACVWACPLSTALTGEILNVPIPGKQSLLRVGALPDRISDPGRAIAKLLMEGLENQDRDALIKARLELQALQQKENFGGAYSAMHWITGVLSAPDEDTKRSFIKNPLDQHYLDFFLANDSANLKEYLQRKFGVKDFRPEDPEHHMSRTKFLEDMIIFNNPARSTWDSGDAAMAIIERIGDEVKRVIDVGAGFGYFSYRLAQIVGSDGAVYAADTSESAIAQLKEMIRSYPLGHIIPLVSAEDDISISETSDLVFISSLYHVLYSWSPFQKRHAFLKSIKNSLRPGGYFVILDNNFNGGFELHNSYIEKDLITAQLYYYGFDLIEHQRLSESRYLLVFRHGNPNEIDKPSFAYSDGTKTLSIRDARSAVHIGSLDSFDITPLGIAAAQLLYQALEEPNPDAARSAIAIYDDIIPEENFGGEYTALRWVANYLVASPDAQEEMTADPLTAEFLAYLADKKYERLRFFLSRKYKLGKDELSPEEAADEETRKIGITQRQSLEDFILFNNPERESWERSSLIIEKIPIKAGDTIVDVGSGPGYYSFKFADLVGERGKVYALDTKEPHIDYVKALVEKWGTKNLFPSVSSTDGLGLDLNEGADVVFMCSLYHILYAVTSVDERDGMLKDIRNVLRPGGKLVIVDNGPVEEQDLPYHGPYIRRELIEAQLAEYGFHLDDAHQIIPQRYLLVFKRR